MLCADRYETMEDAFVNVLLSQRSEAPRVGEVGTAEALPTRITRSAMSKPAATSRTAG